jgi:hypothetical protein
MKKKMEVLESHKAGFLRLTRQYNAVTGELVMQACIDVQGNRRVFDSQWMILESRILKRI